MFDPIYFWKDGVVCKYPGYTDSDSISETEFVGCLAVDTAYVEEMRYGKYCKTNGWVHVALEKFPKEFRTHLLLLGVT